MLIFQRVNIGNLLFCRDAALPKLADVATQPAFKPWELNDNVFRLQLDLASLQPQVSFQ